MPNEVCRMHEGVTERITTLQRERSEDRKDLARIEGCVQGMSERLARIETRIGMWATAGGIIGGAVVAAAVKLMTG